MIQIQCPQCAKHYRVKEDAVGHEVQCPNCRAMILVEAAETIDEPQFAPPFNPTASTGGGTTTVYTDTHLDATLKTSGLAIAALVLGLLGFIPPLGLVALVLGLVAISQIGNPANRLTGHGFAIAGVILGVVGTVGIVLMALLLGMMLPALGAARGAARQMQNHTQLRGIHQSMVVFAQSNNGNYPGITASDQIFDGSNLNTPNTQQNGGSVEVRYQLLLENNYFTGDYAINPAETKVDWWQNQSSPVTSDNYSYSMLQIHSSSTGANNAPDRDGRAQEWSETLNSEAVVMSDRTLDAQNYHSVWTSPTHTGHDWRGAVVRNDNSAFTENSHLMQTRYAGGPQNLNDDIFAESPGAADEAQPYANALMIYAGHDTVEGW